MDAQAALKFNNEGIANCDNSLSRTQSDDPNRADTIAARNNWVTDLAQLKSLIANGETEFAWEVPGVFRAV